VIDEAGDRGIDSGECVTGREARRTAGARKDFLANLLD
jgi:hypothetical protein